MLLQAARELHIDLKKSWMIGDRRSDIEAGWNAGCRSILVKTGYGAESAANLAAWPRQPEAVHTDLAEALRFMNP
jgi:histidinol phosphatase-like enzyme